MPDFLSAITTIMIGFYAGSLLTKGMVLVPFWRRMPPAEFYRLHKEVGPSLFAILRRLQRSLSSYQLSPQPSRAKARLKEQSQPLFVWSR